MGRRTAIVRGGEEALWGLGGTMNTLFGWNKGDMWDKDGSRGGIIGLWEQWRYPGRNWGPEVDFKLSITGQMNTLGLTFCSWCWQSREGLSIHLVFSFFFLGGGVANWPEFVLPGVKAKPLNPWRWKRFVGRDTQYLLAWVHILLTWCGAETKRHKCKYWMF